MTQVSKGVFFPNGCPSCPQWDCIKTPECPPINTVNCGACPSGTKAVKVESVCPSCDKCVPIGSEEATASGTLVETVSEKTGVSVTTSGDPFETEESSGSHATMASIVAIFAFVSAAN